MIIIKYLKLYFQLWLGQFLGATPVIYTHSICDINFFQLPWMSCTHVAPCRCWWCLNQTSCLPPLASFLLLMDPMSFIKPLLFPEPCSLLQQWFLTSSCDLYLILIYSVFCFCAPRFRLRFSCNLGFWIVFFYIFFLLSNSLPSWRFHLVIFPLFYQTIPGSLPSTCGPFSIFWKWPIIRYCTLPQGYLLLCGFDFLYCAIQQHHFCWDLCLFHVGFHLMVFPLFGGIFGGVLFLLRYIIQR